MTIIKISPLTKKQKYIAVNWAITNICNYKCHYCHGELHNGSIKPPSEKVALHFVNNILEYCRSTNAKPYFEFGGGEVTLLRYFKNVAKHIKSNNGLVSIISNGSKPLHWWKETSSYLNYVNLSFHINDNTDISHFISVAEVLQRTPNCQLHINIMMVPERFDECLDLAKNFKYQINGSITLQPLFDGFGSGNEMKQYLYTPEQEHIMKSFSGNVNNKDLSNPRAMLKVQYLDQSQSILSTFDLLINNKINFVGWDCYAGIESMVVTFSGEIYRAWCMQQGCIGSIYDQTLVLPINPMQCQTPICQCGADISSTKINNPIINRHKNIIDTHYLNC